MNMHRLDPIARHIARLVAENETLQEEVRQLREVLTPTIAIPCAWGLSRGQEILLSALYSTGTRILRRERAVMAMCDGQDDGPEPGIVRVRIARLRARLLSVGLPPMIETVRDVGYRLSSEGVEALNEAFATEQRRQDALDASLRAGRGA